tara:strand:+ start:166 stop:693 length:528 start_codon:yes stop_codon:yes gene_type:complete
MELERSNEELELERVSGHYYSSGRYYSRLALINLNFRLEKEVKETNMSATFTLSNALGSELYGFVLEKIFSEFNGKKVGEEFSISEAMKHFELDESYLKKGKKVSKEKEIVKEKKARRKSGYRLFQEKNNAEIHKVWEEMKKENADIKFLTAAGSMWKELSTEEQEKYKEEAKNM